MGTRSALSVGPETQGQTLRINPGFTTPGLLCNLGQVAQPSRVSGSQVEHQGPSSTSLVEVLQMEGS